MNKPRFSLTAVRSLFHEHTIATMPELKRALGSNVDMTVFRKLAELGYHSSYTHRGKYYTLAELVSFDGLGLWSYQGIRFSRWGSLVTTVKTLVTRAEAGYADDELRAVLHAEVKQPLTQLQRRGLIGPADLPLLRLLCRVITENTLAEVPFDDLFVDILS